MKTSSDPRHQKRRDVLKSLYAGSFRELTKVPQITKKILSQKADLDGEIKKAAELWPIDRLNKIDLAILRLAVYELKNEDTPPKVVIDEAVELAKEFGSENSPSFVNGVLGTIYKMSKV